MLKVTGKHYQEKRYFPNLSNLEAHYTIQKENNNYLLNYTEDNQTHIFPIGNSNVALEPYLDKRILIKGDYRRDKYGNIIFSNNQCVLDICHKIFSYGDTVVVDVYNIEVR